MADVPNEITIIILSNLPVKSLLRFKCVSKSWCSWISCPKFQLSNQRRQGAIVASRSTTTWDLQLSYQFINQQLTLEQLYYPSTRWNKIYIRISRLLGSCHGLILVHVNEHICIWNPATRFYTKVLQLDDLNDVYTNYTGGLCFDSSKNVYKAVIIMDNCSPGHRRKYSIVACLEEKRWRQVEFCYDHIPPAASNGIMLHERLHYCVRVKKPYYYGVSPRNEVIYFDPIAEKFNMFPVPKPRSDQEDIAIIGLGVLNECLCMTCLEDDKGGIEILVMKEYGVKESWTCFFSIRNIELRRPFYGSVVPFSMTENGELVLIIDNHVLIKVVVYDLKNDKMRDIIVVKEEVLCPLIITYVESLISPEEYYWSAGAAP